MLDRRSFLGLAAGTAVAGYPLRAWPRTEPRIVVVGAGIVGASIAYHLARRGARVVVLERDRPASAATGASFAWINANAKPPRPYGLLNWAGVQEWHRLEQEVPSVVVRWGGSIEWAPSAEAAAPLRDIIAEHLSWGYPVRSVDAAQIVEMEPALSPGPVAAAQWAEAEGHIDPVAATEALLAAAVAHGAELRQHAEVAGLVRSADIWRIDAGETVEADRVVLAAGVDTPRLAALLGVEIPMQEAPGLLAHTAPLPASLRRVALSPGGHMKQDVDGRVVVGGGFGNTPVTAAATEEGERILAAASRYFPALGDATLDRVTLGWRPLPGDGLPVVGELRNAPGVHVAVMHSGVSLSPIVGRLAASEILDGVRVEPLERFRPERFDGEEAPRRRRRDS